MAILITNDDGYSEGFKVLFAAAGKTGEKCYALLPDRQKSAISKAITLHKALRMHRHGHAENVYTLNGTPADTVLFSIYSKEFEKPKLVLSGVNYGDNATMSAILSSGTLGACWEATLEGIPAIAFSMYKPDKEWKEKSQWGDTVNMENFVTEAIALLRKKFRKDSFFSVSLPYEYSDSTKIVFATKTQRQRFKTVVTKRLDPYGTPYYWLSGDFSGSEKGTDLYEVAVNKNVVITEISLGFVK
jgi:5'-nucleotidase